LILSNDNKYYINFNLNLLKKNPIFSLCSSVFYHRQTQHLFYSQEKKMRNSFFSFLYEKKEKKKSCDRQRKGKKKCSFKMKQTRN
jgi:hypothetical protein